MFKNVGTPRRTSDRLPRMVPATSPCAICASSGQDVINLCLNIPASKVVLGCTFGKRMWKALIVLCQSIYQGPLNIPSTLMLTLSMEDICSGAKADLGLEAQGSEIVCAPHCQKKFTVQPSIM